MRAVVYTYTARPNAEARDRQRDECRTAAHALGFNEVVWVHDESGDRSGLAHIHDLATAGEVDAVVVWSLDRFGRRLDTWKEQVSMFVPEGVQIVVADSRARDFDPVSPAVAQIVWGQRADRRGPVRAGIGGAPEGPGVPSHPWRR